MPPVSELVRPVMLEPWPAEPIQIAFGTTADERHALARRFGLIALDALEGRATIDPLGRPGVLAVTGEIEAQVVQACVISLEPVAQRVAVSFERHFARPEKVAASDDVLVDPDAVELEPLESSRLELGELVAEELALALDPYPHAEGAYEGMANLGPDVSFGEDGAKERPLAALATLTR